MWKTFHICSFMNLDKDKDLDQDMDQDLDLNMDLEMVFDINMAMDNMGKIDFPDLDPVSEVDFDCWQ